MEQRIKLGLLKDRTIDITTKGRRSGKDRRIEIWFHNVGDKIYITGQPGPRGWYANMLVNPEIIFHIKQSVLVDIPATCRPITSNNERRRIFRAIFDKLEGTRNLNEWTEKSPLVEVELDTKMARFP
jgi:hypothetical protein